MDKFELMRRLVERSTGGKRLESVPPEPLPWIDLAEALWALNDLFRPALQRIRSLDYDKSFEAEADAAIELMADGGAFSWDALSAGAWRVLLERHQQAITVAMANDRAKSPPMMGPQGLNAQQRTAFAAIFLLHSMELPFPAEDRSGFEVPPGSARASPRPH